MRLTNRLNLPDSIVSAVANDAYSKGGADISVTGLLKPPRVAALEREHGSELEEDVSSRIWSLLGQVIHGILERADKTGIAEQRLSLDLEGWKVSGQIDRYENGLVQDYKVTSVHKLLQGNCEEWTAQLNLYAALLRHHCHSVRELQVIAILRDWSKSEARRNPEYPQAQVVTIPLPLWDPEKALEFMRNRVKLHQEARVSLPECSTEERWARPDVYAVMKNGKKRAVKLFASEHEALDFACSGKDLSVVKRPGLSVRCADFCSVLPFCEQGQKIIKTPKQEEGEE